MSEVYNAQITKKDIVASPEDVTLDGIIISITKGLTSEFVDSQYHKDFDEDSLKKEQLSIDFEVTFQNRKITGNDRMNFYEEPLSNTSMAKFMVKYDEGLKVGTKIKVQYNSKGFGKIILK